MMSRRELAKSSEQTSSSPVYPVSKAHRRRPHHCRCRKLREPLFTRNRRGQFLAVKLALDRTARLMADATSRIALARYRSEDKVPPAGLREIHRLFWRIQLRGALEKGLFGKFKGNRGRRWRRLSRWLERSDGAEQPNSNSRFTKPLRAPA
jgi:hypothetical protein